MSQDVPKELVSTPDYADVMTLTEWYEALVAGSFVSYDGQGYFATATDMDRSTDCFDMPPPSWATHVAWFNK